MMIEKLPIKRFVIIGSYALGIRYAKDLDIVCYKSDIECEYDQKDKFSGHFDFEGRRIEVLFSDEQESFQMLLRADGMRRVATVEELYGIKRGHATFPSKNWEKHITDLHILKKLITYEDKELIRLHKKSTEYRLGKQKTPRLNGKTREEFFNDNVKYYVEHDLIHELFAHREKPGYFYMQLDPNLVACSKELWDRFTYRQQVETVLEEAMVIASERALIPTMMGDKVGMMPHEAFMWAVKRIATDLCSSWFRSFCIDNYPTIINSYDRNYYKKLEQLNLDS